MLVVIQKYSTSRIVRDWSSPAAQQRRVLICGTTRETRRLFSYLLYSPHLRPGSQWAFSMKAALTIAVSSIVTITISNTMLR